MLSSLQGARHLGISELAAALELPPSTVHGIVKSLVTHGLVAKEPNGNRYMLGPALLKLSNVYLDTLDVRARAMRWTQELARRTGLATRLGAELFDEVIVIHHNMRPDGSEQMPETGLSIPAHASAMGKVLLAYNPEQADELLRHPLRSLTGDTITDPAKLTTAIRADRGAGYRQPRRTKPSSVSPRSRPRSSMPTASSSLRSRSCFPSTEWPPEDNVLNDLRETARNISRELGASTWPPTKSTAG